MKELLVPIGIMVTLAVLGWLSQALKNLQQRQEAEKERQRREALPAAIPADRRERERPRVPVVAARPAGSDVDRFLAEIDRLRQRSTGDGATGATPAPVKPVARSKVKATPVPTVAPAKRARVVDAPTEGTPESTSENLPLAKPVGASPPPAPNRTTEAPHASVVTRPLPRPVTKHGTSVTRVATPTTPFGRQLLALISSPQSVPVAVVLADILGEPKSRCGVKWPDSPATAAPPPTEPNSDCPGSVATASCLRENDTVATASCLREPGS